MRDPPLRHSLEHGAFRAVKWTLAGLPESIAMRIGGLVGLLAASMLRVRRADVDRHLALAFPERSPAWRRRVARGSYVHLGREATMLFRLPTWDAGRLLERVTFTGLDDFQSAVRGGAGAIILTGHLGNWEVAGAAIAATGVVGVLVGWFHEPSE